MRGTTNSSNRSTLFRTIFFAAAMAIVGCSMTSNVTSLSIPLHYAPTDTSDSSFTMPNHPAKVYVAAVTDQRAVKDQIGENDENSNKIVPVMATTMVPQYVHDAVVSQLRSDGITVVDAAADADRTINLTLVKFWAVESPDYHATVQLNGTVTGKVGMSTVWNGVVAGDDSTFGRSLNAGNYNQVLSNAVSKATGNLLKQPPFVQAISIQ